MEPHYEFVDFGTSEEKCPIMSRDLYGDAGYSVAVNNGLINLVQRKDTHIQNQYRYFV